MLSHASPYTHHDPRCPHPPLLPPTTSLRVLAAPHDVQNVWLSRPFSLLRIHVPGHVRRGLTRSRPAFWPASTKAASSFHLPPPTSAIESAKQLAAWTAVDKHVLPEDKVRANGISPSPILKFAVDYRHRLRLDSTVCRRTHSRSRSRGQQGASVCPDRYVIVLSNPSMC